MNVYPAVGTCCQHDSKELKQNLERALNLRKKGNLGFYLSSANALCSVAGTVLEKDSYLGKIVNFGKYLSSGIRNHFQYSIYSRSDDDLEDDRKNRPHAANMGEIACFTEKFINPFLVPASFFLNDNVKDSINSICHLPNALWWRIRLFSKNIELQNFIYYIKTGIKLTSSQDKEFRDYSQSYLNVSLYPLLGLSGFIYSGLFTPIKSWNRFIGHESKAIDFFSGLGNVTQHLIYFLRFTLPEYWEGKMNEENQKNHYLLFTLGTLANSLNICSPFINLIPNYNGFIKTTQNTMSELASSFTMMFFSRRRHVMGVEMYPTNSSL